MEEWKEYRYTDIATLIGGGTPKTSNPSYWGGNIPWLSVKDFGNDAKYVYQTEKTITEEGLNNSSTKLLQKDDIIISARGTIGEMAMIPFPMSFNQSCFGIRGKENVDKDFLYYLTKTKINNLKSSSHGSVFDTITRATFDNIIVYLPPLPTQQKIANILSSLDDKIEVNRRINEQLEELAGALFKSWFVDFEPFKDGEFVDSELGMIPKGWKVVEVGELCDSISVKHKFDKDELIFLNTGDIHNNIYLHNNYMPINEMPGQAKKSIRKGDILYSEIRPINKHFAFVNFEANDYVVSTKLMVIRCRNINNLRLYQYLTSNEIIDFLQQEAETRSGTFPQIRFENIQRLKMIIASPIVEEQYNQNLLPIYNKIEINNEEIHHLTTLRDTLLPKLMSGEIDVNEVKI